MTRLSAIGAAFLLCLLAVACGPEDGQPKQAPQADDTEAQPGPTAAGPEGPIPLGRLPQPVTPTHYRLDFTIAPESERFSGRSEIAVTLSRPQRALYLHGRDLRVSEAYAVLANGTKIPASYRQVHDSGVARLEFAREIPSGLAKLVFAYDAPFGHSLEGLYKVVDHGIPYAFTQFEAIEARMAFPSFDEPGFKTPFDISVTAPKTDKVIGNAPVVNTTPAANGMTKTVFETTKPLPTYLIALAVGPLDIVDGGDIAPNQYRERPVRLRGITAKGNGPRIAYALSLTPKILTALEDYFGIAYPFQKLDILAVPDFAAGAMENAGAITYRERLLLMDAKASLEQKRDSMAVQAHELTHQWFGDLVTPTWWDDIWLNESFAVWLEYKIAATVLPQEEYDREILRRGLKVMALDELASARRIHQPVNGPDDIENAFDDISYSKGAAVLAMFESYVGEEAMQRGIHAYLNKFAFRSARAKDFIGAVAQETGHPEMVEAFSGFIDKAGVPLLQVKLQCTPEATANVKQSMYVAYGRAARERQWQVPLCMAPAGGEKICKMIGAPSAEVPLGAQCPAALMPNAEGKGYYRFGLEGAGWQALIAAAPGLGPADQLTLFANINAGLHAGYASAAEFFAAVRALAPVAKWDLLLSMQPALREFRIAILPSAENYAYRAFVAKEFGPRLPAVGLMQKPDEPPADTLARRALVALMVEEARDPATIAALAKGAQAYVASKGKNVGFAPDLLPDAILAGLLANGPKFGDSVLAMLASSKDEYVRGSLIRAVTASDNSALVAKMLALTPKMRAGDLRYIFQFAQDEAAARDTTWTWFKQNLGALAKRLSPYGMVRTPALMSTACEQAARDDLQSFFLPQVTKLRGVARPLKLTGEQIERCIAFKKAKGAEVTAALHAAVR